MKFARYIAACKTNINRKNYCYHQIQNLTTLPKNLFQGFPPVYLITFNNSAQSIESQVNIRLSRNIQELKSSDLNYLSEYSDLCEQYNQFLIRKKRLKNILNQSEANYKYHKYITKNCNILSEYQNIYRLHKANYNNIRHFDRVKLVLMDDLYQFFLSKI